MARNASKDQQHHASILNGPECQAQDAIISRSRDTYVIGAQPHFGRLARWISLHHTITYIHGGIQQYIQVTWIQQHQYKASDYGCKHEKHNDIHLLSQAADPEPNPRLKKKKELQTTNIALTSRHRKIAPATVVVVSVSHEDSAIP